MCHYTLCLFQDLSTKAGAVTDSIIKLKVSKDILLQEQMKILNANHSSLTDVNSVVRSNLSTFKKNSKRVLESTERSLVKSDARVGIKLKSIEKENEDTRNERAEVRFGLQYNLSSTFQAACINK